MGKLSLCSLEMGLLISKSQATTNTFTFTQMSLGSLFFHGGQSPSPRPAHSATWWTLVPMLTFTELCEAQHPQKTYNLSFSCDSCHQFSSHAVAIY